MATVKKTKTASKPVVKKAAAKETVIKKPAAKKAAIKKPAAKKITSKTAPKPAKTSVAEKHVTEQRYLILKALDDGKAEDILDFDLRSRSSLADYLIIASGKSTRQVAALAENISKTLKKSGHKILNREGANANDWVVVDTGDIIVHIFRPEVRSYYRLEEIWQK
jgi:ribosome-associated protein